MRLGGTTTRKRLTAAGGTAILAGMATAALGLTAGPAAADVQTAATATFTCTGGPVDLASLPVSVDVAGSLPASVQEGDTPSLSGFKVTASVSAETAQQIRGLGVTSLVGSFSDFPVDSSLQDVSVGAANPGVDGLLDIDTTTVEEGGFSFNSPAAPITLGPFEANQPGTLTIRSSDFSVELTLNKEDGGTIPASLDCTSQSVIEIATVEVKEKETPPPPTGKPTTNPQGPDKPGQPSDDNNSTAPSGGQTSTPAGTNNDDTTTPPQARPELANTGMPYTIPMTATGSALVLLGAGMVVLSRRRAMTAALASDEAGDGADTSKD